MEPITRTSKNLALTASEIMPLARDFKYKELEKYVESQPPQSGLKKELGLFSAINLILGVMIGSGIFISPAAALQYTGSVGMSTIVWAVSGLISLMGALAFAEMGTVVPRSGAEYAYYLEAFKPLHRYWGQVPAFICSWIYVFVLRPAEVAVILLTFSEYSYRPVLAMLGVQGYEDETKKIIAFVALALITLINMTSVKLYLKIQNTFCSFKIIACLVVIGGGIYQLCMGNTENLYKGFEGTNWSPKNLALAFYSGLWAYDGWTACTTVTEEIKKPEKNIPRSIMISVPIVTGLYVFMNLAYMTVLTIPEMTSAPAVAVLFGDKALGPIKFIVPLGVVLSTFGCALSIQFGVSRLCYVAGQEGHMIECMSYVNQKSNTPSFSVFFQGILTSLYLLSGNIVELIEFVSFLIWISYGGAMSCVFILRRTQKEVHRPYKVPSWIPVFVAVVALFLAVIPIVTDPSPKYLIAIGFILLGMVFYHRYVFYGKRPDFMDVVTRNIETIFKVEPQAKC